MRHRTASKITLAACDAGGVAGDLGSIEALCRTTLEARRRGDELRFHDVAPELVALLELAGLAGVVRCDVRKGGG